MMILYLDKLLGVNYEFSFVGISNFWLKYSVTGGVHTFDQ